MFQTKSFSQSSFSPRSWKFSDVVESLTTIYNVVRVHVNTLLKRTTIKVGKRTVTITEGVIR